MEIKEILKPCPFCGHEISIASIDYGRAGITRIEVSCPCGADFKIMSDPPVFSWEGRAHQLGLTAVDKWNQRIIPKESEGE